MIRYTSVATFLLFAIALIVPSGFSLGAVMLMLGGLTIYLFPHYRSNGFQLHNHDRLLIGIFCLYFTVNSLLNFIHIAPAREYDTFSRFLLAIPALFLLLHYPPKPVFVWSGIVFGALSSGIYAIVQVMLFDHDRAMGSTNPIQYGNICMLLAVLCLCGLIWAWQQQRRCLWLSICTTVAILGIIGSLLTGSRGSWLGLPVSAIILLIYLAKHISAKTLLGLVVAIVLAPGLVALAPDNPVKQRIHIAGEELDQYMHHRNTSTSIGTRLEMWRSATLLIPERPLLGWGKQGYQQKTLALANEGSVGATLTQHSHLHNDYIDATVKHGIVGLATVLALYIGLLILFCGLLRTTQTINAFAIAGILLMVNYIFFGLTQAFLTHNNGVMLLAFSSIVLWSCARRGTTSEDVHTNTA
jgi:O-antigen ligase